MPKTRQELMDEAMGIIEDQIRILSERANNEVLKFADARALADYVRVLSLVEKDRREAAKEANKSAATMTDEELDAELLRAAEAVKVKRGSPGT